MARNELRSNRRQLLFTDVQVCATHSASDDPKQDVPCFQLWTWNIFDMKECSGAVCAEEKMAAFIVLVSPEAAGRLWAYGRPVPST